MRKFKGKLLAAASALAIVGGLYGPAAADNAATAVTQTATHLDAAVFWGGQANGATSCNTVSQTAANDTITITPAAGQFVYLTSFIMQHSTDATGATEVPTISMTNIGTGGTVAAFLSAASTLSTTGYTVNFAIPFGPGGLKAAAPGTAVTFVPSATLSAHTIMCNSVTGYYNAN